MLTFSCLRPLTRAYHMPAADALENHRYTKLKQ
jgi:hypothetical protein